MKNNSSKGKKHHPTKHFTRSKRTISIFCDYSGWVEQKAYGVACCIAFNRKNKVIAQKLDIDLQNESHYGELISIHHSLKALYSLLQNNANPITPRYAVIYTDINCIGGLMRKEKFKKAIHAEIRDKIHETLYALDDSFPEIEVSIRYLNSNSLHKRAHNAAKEIIGLGNPHKIHEESDDKHMSDEKRIELSPTVETINERRRIPLELLDRRANGTLYYNEDSFQFKESSAICKIKQNPDEYNVAICFTLRSDDFKQDGLFDRIISAESWLNSLDTTQLFKNFALNILKEQYQISQKPNKIKLSKEEITRRLIRLSQS